MQRPRRRGPAILAAALALASAVLLLLLLRCGGGKPRSGSQPVYAAPGHTSSSGGGPAPAAKLNASVVVLVIASREPVYALQWAVWSRLKDDHPDVAVYLLVANESLAAPQIDEAAGLLQLPMRESYIPGILDKTVEGLRVMLSDTRRSFKYVLRTNMSSMWHWARFMAHVAALPASGVFAGVTFEMSEHPGVTFASGAGYTVSRDVARTIVEGAAELNKHVLDDVAVGLLLGKRGVRPTGMGRCDLTDGKLPAPLDDGKCHHWRTKNHDRLKYDGYLMSRLYFELYPLPPALVQRQ
ncbi:hypothetical protein Rsub_13338 [Raphidocelis subcapitata]|uniref:Hexosyltransferase n=1 Tax=Raphidocelis subcapitata TaxID=307507 RepID=A0A2V0PQQ4_9CHLO|nr:hypothetical protein Rsub_13338 [Raphidocelis subcapitata]|eukprot:GBG00401.1 hypothetical protein Rsub_13338 [Raphidocelis subcapitata]